MYFDSSALVKLLVDEPETPFAWGAWRLAPGVTISSLALLEISSALRRAIKGRRVRPASAAVAWRKFEAMLDEATVIIPVESVAVQAAGYASLHALRGFDAVHLACARLSADAIVTFDRDLALAATAEGLTVIGA